MKKHARPITGQMRGARILGNPHAKKQRDRTPIPPRYKKGDYLPIGQAFDQLLRTLGMPDEVHTDLTGWRLVRYIKHLHEVQDAPRLTVFPNEDPEIDQMVLVSNIDFWSACSHHMLPFFGTVTVGYIPKGHIIGLSKIPLLVRYLARRPTLQEHLAEVIADALRMHVKPKGIGVHIRAQHTCQLLDLAQPPIPVMTTTVLKGVMRNAPARAEFLKEVQP